MSSNSDRVIPVYGLPRAAPGQTSEPQHALPPPPTKRTRPEHAPAPARRRAPSFPAAPASWIVALTAGFALLLGGCRSREDASLVRLRESGVIRIGYAVEAPFAYVSGNQVTGESPEIARIVCRRLGIPHIQWVQMPFDELIPALRDRRCDVIAAGMFITDERRRLIAFSIPTFQVRPGLLVQRGDPHHLGPDSDLARDKALHFAVLSGSIEERWFEGHGFKPSQLVIVPDAVTGRAAVEAGMADALALSSLSIRRLSGGNGATEAILLQPAAGMQPGFGAFGFRLGDKALRRAWDGVLQTFVGSAEHRRLVARFGFGPAEIPTLTVASHQTSR